MERLNVLIVDRTVYYVYSDLWQQGTRDYTEMTFTSSLWSGKCHDIFCPFIAICWLWSINLVNKEGRKVSWYFLPFHSHLLTSIHQFGKQRRQENVMIFFALLWPFVDFYPSIWWTKEAENVMMFFALSWPFVDFYPSIWWTKKAGKCHIFCPFMAICWLWSFNLVNKEGYVAIHDGSIISKTGGGADTSTYYLASFHRKPWKWRYLGWEGDSVTCNGFNIDSRISSE